MAEWREFIEGPSDGTGVRGFLHTSATGSRGTLILTHGAGANCQSPLLVQLSIALSDAGYAVLRCDLPFRQLRPKGPPRGSSASDQQGLRMAVEALKRHLPGPYFLGGHSYGGRQASMLVAGEPDLVDALLLLSYPLHPSEKPNQMRTSHFPDIRTPALFVHGTRDGFGSLKEMETALRLIPGRTQLLPVEGAGHGIISSRTAVAISGKIAAAFSGFVAEGLPRSA